ncbi:hypothetical protein ACFE04_030112 [Oxalis oulophora]
MEHTNNREKHIEEENNEDPKRKKVGGIKTMPFIIGNEMCDRFATVGFHANMITYLTQVLNMPLVKASNTLTNFNGTASLTPLIGALIADSFAGRFWTIVVGSIIYELGLISITIAAILPSLRPPPCPSQSNCEEATSLQLSILYIALILTSIGTGGLRPCVVTFAADQFDMTRATVASRSWNFFNWYYICMALATLSALTIVVYVQDHVGWGWGLGIPTIGMAVSIVAFMAGSRLYLKLKPEGSPMTRIAQVIAAAIKKKRYIVPRDSTLLYRNNDLDDAIAREGRIDHTNQFKWLDKAAIVTEKDFKSSQQPDLWRIATVHRVEELKSIIKILPLWAAGILVVTSFSHNTSFAIQQARSMDRHLSHSIQFPPASLAIFSNLTLVIGLLLYERLLVPFSRKFTNEASGLTTLQRMGIGYVINILATLVASYVEIKRKSIARNHDLLDDPKAVIPISVFWLVPQYCLHGLAEVFINVGQLEFLYNQSPESMRSCAAALYWIGIALGNFVGTLLVTLVHNFTNGKEEWLPDRNLNKGKLECYYRLVTIIQGVNLVYYLVCAWLYTYKPLEEVRNRGHNNGEVKDENNLMIRVNT